MREVSSGMGWGEEGKGGLVIDDVPPHLEKVRQFVTPSFLDSIVSFKCD